MKTALAQRLRAWREKTNRTQTQAGQTLGMAFRTYQDIEGSISNASAFVRASLHRRMDKDKIPDFQPIED